MAISLLGCFICSILSLVLLCFIFDSVLDDFNLFNRVGKAWTAANKQKKIMKITNVFHELIDLIEIIYEDSKTIINQQPSNEVDQKDTKNKLIGSLCLKMS